MAWSPSPHRLRHRQPENPGGPQIDDQLQLGRLFDWEVGGPVTPALTAASTLPIGHSSCIPRVLTDKPAASDILQRLLDLRPGVHHKGSVARDRLMKRAGRRQEESPSSDAA